MVNRNQLLYSKGRTLTLDISYGTSDRTIRTRRLVMTLLDLISGVGGNLGLLLGFSLSATLISFYSAMIKFKRGGREACLNMITT